VFLSEPSETPFDLRFWLFGTHVRVSPWFWLISAALGYDLVMGADTRTGMLFLAIWVACVFVSVLLHEFGHGWMGRLFGSHGHIVLHSFGGLAVGSSDLKRGWQRFLVFFAGPLIQFVLFGVLVVYALFFMGADFAAIFMYHYAAVWRTLGGKAMRFLLDINLFWPILNLLPIWPLDGGQMTREVLVAAAPRNGQMLAFGLSALVAGLLAVHCLMVEYNRDAWPLTKYLPFGGLYLAIFFALFCAQNFMAVQAENARRQRYSDDEFPWER